MRFFFSFFLIWFCVFLCKLRVQFSFVLLLVLLLLLFEDILGFHENNCLHLTFPKQIKATLYITCWYKKRKKEKKNPIFHY